MEQLVNEQVFKDLTSQFSSPIRHRDKEKYDQELFLNLRGGLMLIGKITGLVESDQEIEDILVGIDLPNFIQSKEEFIKGGYIESTIDEKIQLFFHLKMRFTDSFTNIPSSGLFCSRTSIARNWLTSFIEYSFDLNKKYKSDITTTLLTTISIYLINYHNDRFYALNNESIGDVIKRIYDEFMVLTDSYIGVN